MDKMRVFIIISLAVPLVFAKSFTTVEINANEGDNVVLNTDFPFHVDRQIQWRYTHYCDENVWMGFIGDPPDCRMTDRARIYPYLKRTVIAINCTSIVLPNVTVQDTGMYRASTRCRQKYFDLTVHTGSEADSEDFSRHNSAATSFAWNRYIPELSLLPIGYYYMTYT